MNQRSLQNLVPGGIPGNKGGSGRPSKQVIADEARAKEIAMAYLERHLNKILAVGLKIATGIKRKRFYPPHVMELRKAKNPKASYFYFETEYDSNAFWRWVNKFVPDARQGIDLHVDSPDDFYRALAAARAAKDNPPIEVTALPEPDPKKLH